MAATLATLLLAAIAAGCPGPSPAPVAPTATKEPARSEPLRLWVIDDPPLAVAARREWSARSQSPLVVESRTSEELLAGEGIAADAVIYPSALIGTLAERGWIVPAPELASDDPQLALDDLFPLQRLRETHWGESAYAVTFGSPQLVLLYRADLFAEHNLTPPQTWEEYQAMVQTLATARPPSADWSPVVEPLADHWRAETLVARAAPYARHRSHYSTFMNYIDLAPLIAGPPWQRALRELAAVAEEISPGMRNATPAEARELLLAGRCAAALCWPTAAVGEDEQPAAAGEPPGPIAVAPLPGSAEVYNFFDEQWEPREAPQGTRVPVLGAAGRLGSVTASASRRRAAMNLLARLSGSQWSIEVAPHSAATTLYRRSHLAAPRRWTGPLLTDSSASAYAEQVAATQSASDSMLTLRIPHRARYLAALDAAIQQAISGAQPPEAALETAANQWRALNQELGTENVQRAYRQSLGLAP